MKNNLWLDEKHVDTKHGMKVFDEYKAAMKKSQVLLRQKDVPESVKEASRKVIENLVMAAEILAMTSLEDAKALEGTDKQVDYQIEIAEQKFTMALEQLAKKVPDNAMDNFKMAWEHAQLGIRLTIIDKKK